MAHVVLFHSALGLRPAVLDFAVHLRRAGHLVHTPDLYDGEVFDSLERGVAKRDALGIPELIRRAGAAVAALPPDLVYAGFSLGAAPAQLLAATRPGARGAILLHGVLPPAALGPAPWPASVPVQLHSAEHDPWVSPDAVAALAGAAPALEVFRYPGSAHLFTDGGLPEHDAAQAGLLSRRVHEFLSR